MKPIHDHDSSDQSCSCTSCFYKSESDKPSLKRFVAHGSRIDKLYYGKYLPLRERKLLERLVRTRAVYDDLRKQILSDSSISFSKSVLKATENKLSSDREFDKIKRSRDIISLVDIVDRGAVLSSENLSECCSCCICGSNINTDETTKRHIHKYKPRYEWRHAYNRGYYRPSRRSKMINTPKHKLGQISEFHKNVRFRTKRVRSEPCTCTYKFSGLMKRASSLIKKKFEQENPTPELKLMGIHEEYKPKVLHATRKSFQKANKSQTCLCENIEGVSKKPTTKVKTSGKMTTEIKSSAKRSVEALRHVKYKARKKFEPPQRKTEAIISGNEKKLDENVFTVKKDSLTKFREKLRQRRERQDWKCDFECYPDECDPEQCYIILKRKKNRNILEKRLYDSTKIEKKRGDLSFNSDISIQVDKNENVKKAGKKQQTSKNNQAIKTMDSISADDIKEKIDTKKIKSGINQVKYGTPVSKMKSRTNALQAKSKLLLPSVFSRDTNKTVSPGINKNILKDQTLGKKKRHYMKLAKEEVPIALNRQAVRVGSSFSFNVEFYKNKPLHSLPMVNLSKAILQNNRSKFLTMKKHNIINVKEKFDKSRKMYHKRSGTLYKHHNIKKNTHVSRHPLKRCFCTLQLKAKETKMHINGHFKSESVQTNKLHSGRPISLPYKCKPNICISGKCNPPVCNNRIRKRTIKHRYISTNTDFENKGSNATITSKSVSSITPNSMQIHADRTPESILLLNTTPATVDVTKLYKPPEQAVRIGSTFSFNVEFSKEYPSSTYSNMNADNFTTLVKKSSKKLKQNESLNKPKPYIHHEYSLIDNSTIKSRRTINKYDLRKCFCTLKFGRPEKKKKITSMSKSTVTSFQSFGQPPKSYPDFKTTGVGTGKKIKKVTLQLQPYECEADMCAFGKYDPYMCQKLLFNRQPKRLKSHVKKLNTDSRKTRATSSLTSATHKSTKTKKVQSALIAHEVPNYALRKTVPTSQFVNKPQPNNSSNRQAVKIGSNFSFNIEFYKEKPRGEASVISQRLDRQVNPVINIHQTPKSVQSQTLLKEDGFRKIQSKPKSIQEQIENNGRSIQIGTAMKRCFCTLSLYKKAKVIRNKEFINTGTKTPNFTVKTQSSITVPQNTMTSKNYKYMRYLDPFECEPYVCVPGICNPYKCLEIIRKKDRIRFSRDMAVITKSRNLKSTSSCTQNVIHPTKDVFIQSNIKEQQKKSIKKRKQRNLSLESNLSEKLCNINPEKARQAVNISSKFSFDVEFSKSLPQEQLRFIEKKIKKRGGYKTDIEIDRNGGNQLSSDSRHGSHVIITKINKGRGVELVKKCFCALKLWKKQETNKNKVSSSVNQSIQPYKVYTVGRVTTDNYKYIPRYSSVSLMKNERCTSQELIVNENIENRISNMNRNFNFGIVQNVEVSKINNTNCPSVGNHKFIENNNSLMHVQALNQVLYHNKSNRSLRLNHANSIKLYKQSTKFSKSSNTLKYTDRSINDEICSKYRLKKVANNIKLLEHSADINHASPFINQSFYAMNIKIIGQEIPIKNKLEPYECEPGVCTPFECDPLKCQEVINKRLLKPVLMTSSTGTNFKSTSSLTSQTISSSIKTRKLQSSEVKKGNKKQLPPNLKNKDIPVNRQVVRVGSSININMEFSKSKSDGQTLKYTPSKNYQKLHNKRRKGHPIEQPKSKQIETRYSAQDDESQPKNIKINHNASNTTPFLERCFCTLKFKKHRKKRSVISTKTQTFRYLELEHNNIKFKNMDSAQNSKSSKNYKNTYSINPYECTPGVCIPDQCDPRQCLKLIERRKHTKNVGVESMRSKNISTSTMTKRQRTKMYDKRIESKSSDSNTKSNKSKKLNLITKPVMQTVHIGSNFSFNVEFFKQNSETLQNSNGKSNTAKLLTKNSPLKKTKGVQEYKKYLKKSKESFPESKKPAFHKTSQTDLTRYVKSTMTNSFINRCFCVAKLRREQNLNSTLPKKSMNEEEKVQPQNKSSLLKRCFCVLKSITTVKEISKNNPNLQLNISSQTEANTGIVGDIPRPQKLAPNECEPGICTPGLCDPYVCDRIIKNRKTQHATIISNTEKYRTRSVCSSVRTPMTVKNKKTQYKTQKAHKQQQRRSSYTSYSKEKRHKKPDPDTTSGRQAVRVGSNFSFDVEFYKLRGMGKDDKKKSILATNYKYNENSIAKTNDKIRKSQNKGTLSQKSITYNQKTKASNVKEKNRASGVSHLLQRCFCTLTFQKQHAKKSSELSTTNNKTPYVKQTPNMRNKNMMKLGKNISDEMKRQEYEPYISIDDTCNPYKCQNRIRKRLQRESSRLTDIYKTKSASSFVSKPVKKDNIKVQSKSKHGKQFKLKVSGKTLNKENHNSYKQAVKISSNFGFDIEFFKEKIHEDGLKISKSPKQGHKSRKNNLFNVTSQSFSNKDKKSQHIKRMRNVESQILEKNVRSTITGVTPLLKRCFCTLKLQKRELKSPSITRNTIEAGSNVNHNFDLSPKVDVFHKTTTSNKETKYAPFMNLKPYECEPGICIPGKCNPYECIKQINIRKKRMTSRSSITQKTKKLSEYSTKSPHAKSIKSQTFSSEGKNRKRLVQNITSPIVSHPSSHRQAVRVASSFCFDIELFKDRSPTKLYEVPKNPKLSVKNKKKSESITNIKNPKYIKSANDEINYRHRQSQLNSTRTDSKRSGMGPFLKKCLCTLKLQKLGKNSKLQPNIVKNTYTETHDVNKIKNLKPYECVPGVCTPGFCDPYECERLIKKRQIRELGTVTERLNLRSTSSVTAKKKKMKSTRTQDQKVERGERKNNIKKPSKKIKSNAIPSPAKATNQRGVSIGSHFSFNIEFSKDRSLKRTRSSPLPQNVKKISKKPKNIDSTLKKNKKSKSRGSQGKRFSYDHGSQTKVTTHTKSKGSKTKLKRCFCTLALQKFSGIPIPNNQFNTISKPKVKPVEVTTQTKIHHNSIKKYSLQPYECEPGICTPGKCNPYDCIKIMQINTSRSSRTTGTQRKQPSQISISTLTHSNLPKSKTVQSTRIFRKKHTIKSNHNRKVLVQEPHFSFSPNLKNKQTIKIGSNVSFDIDFFKKSTPHKVIINPKDGSNGFLAKHKSNKMGRNSKDAKCINSTCKIINSRCRKSQSEVIKTEDKASFLGNALKRCFCTAKLHNTPSILNINGKSINEMRGHKEEYSFNRQQYYVYYQLKNSVKNVCPKRCMCTKYNKDFPKFTNTVGTRTKNKYLKLKSNQYAQSKYSLGTSNPDRKTVPEMVTILPFKSNKFLKKTSKAVLMMADGTEKSKSEKCRPICSDNSDLNQRNLKKYKLNALIGSGVSKKLNNKQIKTSLIKDNFNKPPTSSPLKVVVSRCKEAFAKQKYMTQKSDCLQNSDHPQFMLQKSKEIKNPFKLDNLKMSKSERHSVDKNRNEPKISKSLKMLKLLNDNISPSVSSQRNKKYSRFQYGDMNQNKTIPAIKLNKTGHSNEYKKYISTNYQRRYDNKLADDKVLKSSKQRRKKVKFSGVTSKGENRVRQVTNLNSLIKKILCKSNTTLDKDNKQPTKIRKGESSPRKNDSQLLDHQKCYNIACYSSKDGRWNDRKNNSVIKIVNLKGDDITDIRKDNLKSQTQELIEDIKRGKEITFPLIITSSSPIRENKSFDNKQIKDKPRGTTKASRELKLQGGKQVKRKYYKDSKTKHTLTKNLKSGAKIALPAKTTNKKKSCECLISMNKDKEAKIIAKKMKGKICKCYPSVCECAKVVKIEKERNKKRKAFLKRQLKKIKIEKKRRRRLEKEKKAARKKRRREFFLRQKRYKVEDTIRLHKRRDLNKYLEHRLRTKDTPDYLVATESLLDLAKLSCTVMEDIGRSTYRAIIDPGHTCKRVEATVKKPSRIWPIVKTAIVNSGAPATFKRIILRCKTMSSVKKIRGILERNRCTHYLLHIADRDPRKRLKMKKAQQRLKRQRVPLDFQCSLYMASLRKKPYLKVYFKCPWFYPHFLNMLGVLRQLADMLLFILAAIVWSPCILGMELCRAMMCCLLCTG